MVERTPEQQKAWDERLAREEAAAAAEPQFVPPQILTERSRRKFVELEEEGVKVTVYPIGFGTLQAHAEDVTRAIAALSTIPLEKLKAAGIEHNGIWWAIAPIAGRQILNLVDACCRPSLTEVDAPVGLVARAAAAWFELSFIGGGLTGIGQAAASLLVKFGGEQPSPARSSPASSPVG